MKRVLVTGAFGYVGRYAIEPLLARGFEVLALSSRQRPNADPRIRVIQADLFDTCRTDELLDRLRPTHLLHLAWETTPGKFWNSPLNTQWLEASLTLFHAFANCGGRRVVGVGTCAEYDWKDGNCCERSTPLLPGTLYGTTKLAAATGLEEIAKKQGLSAAWGRLFFMYGAGEPAGKLAGAVLESLRRGEVARCSHGRQVRDFLYVEDAAEALVELLNGEVTGPVNIASGEPRTIRELVEAIACAVGPSSEVNFGAIAASASEPPKICADVRRLHEEVGWRPKHDLLNGVMKMLAMEASAMQALRSA